MPENERPATEVIAEFTRIPRIGLSKAKKLYEKGYRSLTDLKNLSFEELSEIVGEKSALHIRNYLAEVEKKEMEETEKAKPDGETPETEEKEKEVEEEIKVEVRDDREEERAKEGSSEEGEGESGQEGLEELEKEVKDIEEGIVRLETKIAEMQEVKVKSKETKSEIPQVTARKERGLINGRPQEKHYPPGKRKPRNNKMRYVSVGLVLFLMLTSIIIIWYAFLPQSQISVDGKIDDWHAVPTYAENPSGTLGSIEVVEYV
ncbi:MAG: helix-hairpin-helix domain-containing protein, partial [Thermoplasmata archaeon]